MTIHIAPAKGLGQSGQCPIVTRSLARISLGRAANDNERTGRAIGNQTGAHSSSGDHTSDAVLEAALRHFGQHGLGAARAARIKAKEAFFEGDRKAYDWWLAITNALDRRAIGSAPAFLAPFAADLGAAANLDAPWPANIADLYPDNAS